MTSVSRWEMKNVSFNIDYTSKEKEEGDMLATAFRSHIDKFYSNHLRSENISGWLLT